MDNLYTIPQVAERMNVSRQAVYAWIKEGKLHAVKTLGGRYRIPGEQIEVSVSEESEKYYPIYNISELEPASYEPLGTKRKLWFKRADKYWFWECDGSDFLFKIGREGTGENWAEKIACELCRSLKLPHVEYDFAEWRGIRGVITPNFVPDGYELELGNEPLAASIWGYNKEGFRQNQPLRSVLAVIGSKKEEGGKYLTQVPLNWQIVDGIESALDVFIGYLLLDAWIANQDRHHENWGRLIDIEKRRLYLAPTFDHASSLGRNENDDERIIKMTTRDAGRTIEHFVKRAKSAFTQSPRSNRKMSTVEAFLKAASGSPKAANTWREALGRVNENEIENIIKGVPVQEMSDVAKEFTFRMLSLNRNTILHFS